MDHHKREKHMFNVRLAKLLGLNRVLNPDSFTIGGYNVYHVVFVIFIVYVILVSVLTCFNGIYYWTDHRTEAILYFGIAETCLFSSYKMSIVVYRSRKIWECLSITRFDFTSHGLHRNAGLLEQWRNRIIRITNMYVISFLICSTLFVLGPMVLIHGGRMTKTLDFSTDDYLPNVINLYAMFSAEMYNAYFNTMYLIEALCIYLFIFFLIIFDTVLISLCLAFSCQLQIINAAFESSGPKRLIKNSNQNNNHNETGSYKLYSLNEHYLAYNDLMTIIIDHQAIMKNLNIFFSIYRNIMLSQIVASTYAIISIWINLTMNFVDGNFDPGSRAIIIKMISACPVIVFQLYLTCYLFEFLHNQKKSIIFALYSSNWTEMDMKCRKLILFSLRMTNAHKQKLKFSRLKIVNLEMFFGTMRVCYSVLSMMLNHRSKN